MAGFAFLTMVFPFFFSRGFRAGLAFDLGLCVSDNGYRHPRPRCWHTFSKVTYKKSKKNLTMMIIAIPALVVGSLKSH